ncbi:MAG: 3-deoxy-D-manno-octulosonic acid transferase [Sedimentitalea sp.]
MPTPPLLVRLYRAGTTVIVPFAFWLVSRKLRRQNVKIERVHERLGHASLARPRRPTVWFHGASVDESLSVLTLITGMAARLPRYDFLITSGTAASAKLIDQRLPPRTQHQFAPLDAPGPVRRFLEHWRPKAAIFVESELWPVTLGETKTRGTPLALLNARLSNRSVAAWKKRPKSAHYILGRFTLMITQNQKSAQDLVSMGADPDRVRTGGNLKSTSAPLPVDAITLAKLATDLGQRPLWVASSIHPGEDQIVIDAHKQLRITHPDLCLLLIPRRPERGDDIVRLITDAGLRFARRSAKDPISPDTQVYLADTLGETGTWYAASPIVFLGGSLVKVGGHNPFEPAQAGAAILTGPHTHNFSETFQPLQKCGAARTVSDADTLAHAVENWLSNPGALEDTRAQARTFVLGRQATLNDIIGTLIEALELGET